MLGPIKALSWFKHWLAALVVKALSHDYNSTSKHLADNLNHNFIISKYLKIDYKQYKGLLGSRVVRLFLKFQKYK